MMVMGLVMLGAIETNQAPLDVADTTPIAALTLEPEAIVVREQSDIRDLRTSWAHGAPNPAGCHSPTVGPTASTRSCSASSRRRAAIDPSADEVHRLLGRRRGEPGDPVPARSARRSRARRSSRTRSTRGKMRVLAVSTAEPVEVGGKRCHDPRQRLRRRDGELARRRRSAGHPPGERDAMVAAIERLHEPRWHEALERNGWNDCFKPGDEFTALPGEARTRRPHHRRPRAGRMTPRSCACRAARLGVRRCSALAVSDRRVRRIRSPDGYGGDRAALRPACSSAARS